MPNIGLTAVAFIPYVFSLVVAWSYLVRFGRVAELGQTTVDTSLAAIQLRKQWMDKDRNVCVAPTFDDDFGGH